MKDGARLIGSYPGMPLVMDGLLTSATISRNIGSGRGRGRECSSAVRGALAKSRPNRRWSQCLAGVSPLWPDSTPQRQIMFRAA
jgi:hypothetical protein